MGGWAQGPHALGPHRRRPAPPFARARGHGRAPIAVAPFASPARATCRRRWRCLARFWRPTRPRRLGPRRARRAMGGASSSARTARARASSRASSSDTRPTTLWTERPRPTRPMPPTPRPPHRAHPDRAERSQGVREGVVSEHRTRHVRRSSAPRAAPGADPIKRRLCTSVYSISPGRRAKNYSRKNFVETYAAAPCQRGPPRGWLVAGRPCSLNSHVHRTTSRAEPAAPAPRCRARRHLPASIAPRSTGDAGRSSRVTPPSSYFGKQASPHRGWRAGARADASSARGTDGGAAASQFSTSIGCVSAPSPPPTS